MTSKVILLFALVGAATAKPRLGLPDFFGTQVVGGSEATPHQFPFIVSLQWKSILSAPTHFCGGSIINERWIVTAGHCVQAVPGFGTFYILAGKHNIKNNEPTQQSIRVQKSFVHEKYQGGVGPHDVGLLLLTEPLKFNNEVQPIALAKASSDSGVSVLAGWGSTSRTNNMIMPDKLQFAELELLDLETCRKAIESVVGPSPLHETNVCTGPIKGGFSACKGDSGGPLIVTGKQNELIGIVSWGVVPCGTPGAPSVYVRVSAFVDWIQNVIATN